MIVQQLIAAPEPEMARALERFEGQFRYPLGPGRFFRISHGKDYPRFFRAMGDGACFVAIRDGAVLGVVGAAVRGLVFPDGVLHKAVYFGDVKIDPMARGGRTLLQMAESARQWIADRVEVAFAVVMDGTPVIPARYTGRLGIPLFSEVGKIVVLRVPTSGIRHAADNRWLTSESNGEDCYLRLSAGRYACPGGHPDERSESPSTWLMEPGGNACGRLEDTRRAKRLIADDGAEMQSAHLSCFAFQDTGAGVELLQAALGHAAGRGLPALFVAVPAIEAEEFVRLLGDNGVVLAPATIYGVGLTAGIFWNINTAEI